MYRYVTKTGVTVESPYPEPEEETALQHLLWSWRKWYGKVLRVIWWETQYQVRRLFKKD